MIAANTSDISPEFEAYRESYPHGPLLRPAGKLRIASFLTINFLAYAFVNAFLHYLSSGSWISTTAESYKQSMASPFGDMLLSPLNVFAYPWLIVVAGLLLAAVITVPLLVACMYHSRASVVFLFCPAVLGHAPILTLVLAVGCVLVAATVLRRRNPILALLMGLAPVFVYLYFSASPAAAGTPMRQLVLRMPFLAAAVAAILACVIVLLIAHWTRYVPGVICPVLVVLAITPIWLFNYGIGPDEMAYCLLADKLTASEGVFESEPLGADAELRSAADWSGRIIAARQRLEKARKRLVRRCDAFLARYPRSPRRPTVLWIRGLALDSRLSLRSLEEGYFTCYDSQPREASRTTWEQLLSEYPDDGAAAVAAARLGRLDALAGEFARCVSENARALTLLPDIYAADDAEATTSGWGELFTAPPKRPSRAYLRRLSDAVRELSWTIERNDVLSDQRAAEAFGSLLQLDREMYNRSEYTDRLMLLGEIYVDTPLADNILLADIMDIANVRVRAMQLREMEALPGSDVSIKANYELGRLAMRKETVQGLGRILARPEVYFRRVTTAVDNPWRLRAEQYLLKLKQQEKAP